MESQKGSIKSLLVISWHLKLILDQVPDDLLYISSCLSYIFVCLLEPYPLHTLQVVTASNDACGEKEILVKIIKGHVNIFLQVSKIDLHSIPIPIKFKEHSLNSKCNEI
jgi:hypothetical protein